MGEYHCLLFNGDLSEKRASAIRALLVEENATLVSGYRDTPNGRRRGWISLPNLGFPFDRDAAARIRSSLEDAGLWPIPDEGD